MGTRLIAVDGPDRGREIAIPAMGGTVGRGEACGIRLGDAAVSREHFRLDVRDGQIAVVDLGSTNRTRVNGEPVTERVLVPGDCIAVGKTVLQVVPDGGVASLLGDSRVTVELDAAALGRAPAESRDAVRLARYLVAMTQIGEAVHGVGNAVAVVEAARTRLREALGADRVEIVRERRGRLELLAGDGVIALGREPVERALASGRASAACEAGREIAVAPLPSSGGRALGVIVAERTGAPWDRLDVELCAAAGHVIAAGLTTNAMFDQVRRDRDALRERTGAAETEFLGVSPAAIAVRELVARVGPVESTVLLFGESGVGKELVAAGIHAASRRAQGPMVTINCAALTETLLESELFGHEKGAFTGATERRPGRFEQADGGTLFLDEIGELSARCQAKLLRVLETRQVERLGGTRSTPVDVRVLAATHRDLAALVRAGEFRQDLYFRLEVIVGTVPPLRERRADLGLLAERFLRRFDAQVGRKPRSFGASGLAALAAHHWPGNVRELRNTVERLGVLCDADPIEAADVAAALGRAITAALAPSGAGAPAPLRTLDQAEEEAVRAAFAATAGNKLRAAELLGIDRTTLYKKLKRYGLA